MNEPGARKPSAVSSRDVGRRLGALHHVLDADRELAEQMRHALCGGLRKTGIGRNNRLALPIPAGGLLILLSPFSPLAGSRRAKLALKGLERGGPSTSSLVETPPHPNF